MTLPPNRSLFRAQEVGNGSWLRLLVDLTQLEHAVSGVSQIDPEVESQVSVTITLLKGHLSLLTRSDLNELDKSWHQKLVDHIEADQLDARWLAETLDLLRAIEQDVMQPPDPRFKWVRVLWRKIRYAGSRLR